MTQGSLAYAVAGEIFPICRSLTGDGVRETFSVLKKYMPTLQVHEVPTGTQVNDWTIPQEWNIKGGYIEDEAGNHIVDFKNHNLHVMGYSTPVDEWLELPELLEHVYTQPDQPDVIPYVTSYYTPRWGFCMSENLKQTLKSGKYHAVIDSTLEDGSLTYGEIYIPGETTDEILLSSYICHPSMANNECSGPALMTQLYDKIMSMEHRRYSYRLLLLPETIGAITYISQHREELREHVKCGFVLTCVGDDNKYSMVETPYADTLADKVLKCALAKMTDNPVICGYIKRGSDERQYCAPGVELPVVCFCRSRYHDFAEYHTSADNMDFISPAGLQGAYDTISLCIDILEENGYYRTTVYCEPQLGRRGLHPTVSQKFTQGDGQKYKDFLAYSDGRNDLIDMARITGMDITDCIRIARIMKEHNLIEPRP